MSDPLKNDFQNARKRGLHGWAQWRTSMNEKLLDSSKTGSPVTGMAPIQKYLKKELPKRHPARNPEILMSYSAARDNSTCLKKDNYLVYGIPRAKIDPKHPASVELWKEKEERRTLQSQRKHAYNSYNSDSSNPSSSSDYSNEPFFPPTHNDSHPYYIQSMIEVPTQGFNSSPQYSRNIARSPANLQGRDDSHIPSYHPHSGVISPDRRHSLYHASRRSGQDPRVHAVYDRSFSYPQ